MYTCTTNRLLKMYMYSTCTACIPVHMPAGLRIVPHLPLLPLLLPVAGDLVDAAAVAAVAGLLAG